MLKNDNYFSAENSLKYMSVSQFKAFEKCEASALAELNGEWEREQTTALLIGSYVDSYFEGALDNFKLSRPELFKKDGSLKSDFVLAENVIRRIERDAMFMDYLSGDKQVIMTGAIADVPIKIKVDVLHKDRIVDLKVMKDFAPQYIPEQGRVSWIEAWRYDLQGAVYQEIVRQNTGKTLPFFLAAATKEKEPDIGIFEVPQSSLDFELERFTEKVGVYQLIKRGVIPASRCEKCGYCRSTKILTKIIKLEELNND